MDIYKYSTTSITPYKRICISQTLGVLSPGNYKLEFNSATRDQNQLNLIGRFEFSASIRSIDSSTKSFVKTNYVFSSFGSVSRT